MQFLLRKEGDTGGVKCSCSGCSTEPASGGESQPNLWFSCFSVSSDLSFTADKNHQATLTILLCFCLVYINTSFSKRLEPGTSKLCLSSAAAGCELPFLLPLKQIKTHWKDFHAKYENISVFQLFQDRQMFPKYFQSVFQHILLQEVLICY